MRPPPSDAEALAPVLDRFARVRTRVDRARRAVADRAPAPTETADRLAMFAEREEIAELREGPTPRVTTDALDTRERIIGADDILRISFLGRGMVAARSVGRIIVAGGLDHGTGFLVAPDILMTNNHVLPEIPHAAAAEVEFEQHDLTGGLTAMPTARLDPGRFWFTDALLDITLVALMEGAATEPLGWHPMIAQQGKIRIGDPVNIIQHPGGRGKSVVVHNSNLLHLENPARGRDAQNLGAFLWYDGDTEKGSSGAPVFNRHWEVVGVHHRGVPRADSAGYLLDAEGKTFSRDELAADPDRAVWIANEGTRTSRIVAALTEAEFEAARHARRRDALLELWDESRLHNRGQASARASAADLPAHEGAPGAHGQTGKLRAAGVVIRISIEPETPSSG